MKDEDKEFIVSVGKGFGTVTVLGLSLLIGSYLPNSIPIVDKVQNGYAIPYKIKIRTDDLDKNGIEETLFNYKGEDYLLRVDEQDRPYISTYEFKPAEILEKKK